MSQVRLAVIGAGTTGSSIAYFLTQRGLRPVVFEKTRAAGGPSGASAGMCRQHYADPAIIDMGSQLWMFYVGDEFGSTGIGLATLDKSELH